MKHGNKKWRDEKKFIALRTLYWEKCEAINNLGWIELDRPYQDGWHAFISLRNDVANREDAWVFQYIIDKFSNRVWAGTVDDFWWNRKWNRKYASWPKPQISGIDDHAYEALPPQVKKWFVANEHYVNPWWPKSRYHCVVPDFFFKVSYRKNMVTKVRAFDGALEAERAFLRDKLDIDFPEWRYGCGAAPKRFRKTLNRAERAKSKQALHMALRSDDMEFHFRENHKGAGWLYW